VVALALSALVGISVGLVAAFMGGSWDSLLMRLIDILLAFPGVILAIAIIAIVGPGIPGLIISLSIFPIPSFARLSRATALVVMQQEYIEAAHSLGVGQVRIVLRHVLPNIMGPLLVQASLTLPGIILVGSSLGFLGLGVQPPTPEWGAMLSRGRDYVTTSPHLSIFPGMAVTLVVLGFTLAGDALRDMLDPHLRKLEA
jgi:peptide/nickel transport system permease protein